MDTIGPVLKLAIRLKPRHDDDFVDRLHYVVTPSMLLTFAMIIACKQFVGQPIQCWAPHEMANKRTWMQYAENYCFIENTYYVSMDERFPMQPVERERREIHYYQWIVFILAGQALFLILPKFLWVAFSWKSGFDIRTLVQRAQELSANGEFEGKEQASKELSECIEKRLKQYHRKNMSEDGICKANKMPEYPDYYSPTPSACYVACHLLLFKLLNLLVVLIQLYFLTKFLNNDSSSTADSSLASSHHYWGISVVQDLLSGRDWRQSGAFPRVTYCDFYIRQAQRDLKPLRYSMQCVLMINMINEKFFLIVWFWLGWLLIAGSANLCLWLFRILALSSSEHFIEQQLRFSLSKMPDSAEIRHFVRRGLCRDGVVVLRLIAMNCDPTMTSLLICHLWKRFRQALCMGRMKNSVINPNFTSPKTAHQSCQ